MKRLRRSHKNLMIIEAGFIYCKRHNLIQETFIDDVFMTESSLDDVEFNNICKDLLCYKYYDSYKLIEITDIEYEMCVDKFGADKMS